ncbi:conserved hypothetical protein [Histoplasma capsulatum G186AR]|uniref:Major facilitator superfamily (MFS) profile domain-containing protein n=2 Tax=Ajellomyces capsulatus TaxID=5037 RepID=C0NFY9_AJECG|nr:uncharacterized protein HCBG_01805 [Histoplasma capsulatum G186AR]EEH10160.1 conserved hypothetical protein [Histoplasma capsulatum G186AR]
MALSTVHILANNNRGRSQEWRLGIDFTDLGLSTRNLGRFDQTPAKNYPQNAPFAFYLWMGLQSPSSGGATLTERPGEGGCGGDNIAAVTAGGEMINREGTDELERKLRLKVDIRLCTIAGILCSLNLLDSGIISSASVTSMMTDLSLEGNRYSAAIFIFTIASVIFQLPSTVAVRLVGPRRWFSLITICFGVITLCTTFVENWRQMIVVRFFLGMSVSGMYPGLTYLISTWYTREEQQLRFAFLQAGEVSLLASGNIMNYGLNLLGDRSGLEGWRWMFLVNGLITIFFGIITYWWMIDFPENAHHSFRFFTKTESDIATRRIHNDRKDAIPEPFSISKILVHFLDFKLYGFSCLFFLLNLVATSLSYFLPIILQGGMGFDTDKSILLSAPPYYYAIIPVLLTSLLGDKLRLRGPLIVFNSLSLIAGFLMLGLPASQQVTVRYIGIFLATGAYVSNWAALNAYQANNIVGQWKRATVAASVTACNGLGGIAGSFIVKSSEAPTYETAVWVSIG